MTQMLLFDAPANTSAFPVATSESTPAAPARQQPESGLHHMGDLARLVLLRYELVARRRAKARSAARRQTPVARG